MKKFFYTIFAFAALTMVSCGEATEESTENGEGHGEEAPAATSGTFTAAEGSTITWKAKHYKDADYVHVGTVPVSGNVIVDNDVIVGGEFSIDIINLDEEGDSDYNKMLEGHLQDSTFFNTVLYPNATLTINGTEGNKVMATLEVVGIKTDVALEGFASFSGNEMTYEGSTTLDMLTFNMPFLIASEQAPEEEKGQSPDPQIMIEVSISLTK